VVISGESGVSSNKKIKMLGQNIITPTLILPRQGGGMITQDLPSREGRRIIRNLPSKEEE